MAGNPKTPKSVAPKSGRPAASTKGVKVGVNKASTLPGNKTMSSAVGMKKKK